MQGIIKWLYKQADDKNQYRLIQGGLLILLTVAFFLLFTAISSFNGVNLNSCPSGLPGIMISLDITCVAVMFAILTYQSGKVSSNQLFVGEMEWLLQDFSSFTLFWGIILIFFSIVYLMIDSPVIVITVILVSLQCSYVAIWSMNCLIIGNPSWSDNYCKNTLKKKKNAENMMLYKSLFRDICSCLDHNIKDVVIFKDQIAALSIAKSSKKQLQEASKINVDIDYYGIIPSAFDEKISLLKELKEEIEKYFSRTDIAE